MGREMELNRTGLLWMYDCMQNTFVLLTGKSDNEYVGWVGYYLKAECYLIMTSNFI